MFDSSTKVGPIKVAVVFMDSKCNMNCSFCITENSVKGLSWEEATGLLTKLWSQGFNSLVLGGGEPFLWKHDLVKLTKFAKDIGFIVQVGTNGTILPENFESIPSIDRFVFPFDSHSENSHNQIRIYYGPRGGYGTGFRGKKVSHYSIILDRMNQLKKAGRRMTLSTVITAKNRGDLKGTASFLKNFNRGANVIHAWHLYRFIPQGRGGSPNAIELETTKSDYDLACAEAKSVSPGFRIYKRPDMYFSKTVQFFSNLTKDFRSQNPQEQNL
jgi:MoaA/NifB/PqqE/SkfB family radical SAM enzyme